MTQKFISNSNIISCGVASSDTLTLNECTSIGSVIDWTWQPYHDYSYEYENVVITTTTGIYMPEEAKIMYWEITLLTKQYKQSKTNKNKMELSGYVNAQRFEVFAKTEQAALAKVPIQEYMTNQKIDAEDLSYIVKSNIIKDFDG